MLVYEPAVVLVIMCGIYAATRSLAPGLKRSAIWWITAAIIAIGAAGAVCELVRNGGLGAPTFQE